MYKCGLFWLVARWRSCLMMMKKRRKWWLCLRTSTAPCPWRRWSLLLPTWWRSPVGMTGSSTCQRKIIITSLGGRYVWATYKLLVCCAKIAYLANNVGQSLLLLNFIKTQSKPILEIWLLCYIARFRCFDPIWPGVIIKSGKQEVVQQAFVNINIYIQFFLLCRVSFSFSIKSGTISMSGRRAILFLGCAGGMTA